MTAVDRVLGALSIEEELTGATTGDRPLPLVAPTSEEALVALVRRAAQARLVLLPLGLGSKLLSVRPAPRADLALSTRNLAGIVAHEPDDGTITALAGTRWSDLAARAQEGGHELSPELPFPGRATLGGTVAAGRSGIDRLRRGPLRDQLLGVRALLADGSVAKSGGRLVKNVTGFDLHRLYCGSHGSLCVVLEASLRLYPAPEETRHLVLETRDVSEALARAAELRALQPIPRLLALDADGPRAAAHVHCELAGRASVIEAQFEALPPSWRSGAVHAGDAAAEEHRHFAGGELDPGRSAGLRIELRPSRLDAAWRALAGILRPGDPASFLRIHPGLATIELRLGDATARAVADLAARIRATLAPHGARTTLVGAPRAMQIVDPFGEVGPALPWMRALREHFDPHGLFAAGRGPGGL